MDHLRLAAFVVRRLSGKDVVGKVGGVVCHAAKIASCFCAAYGVVKYVGRRRAEELARGIADDLALGDEYEPVLVPCRPNEGGMEIAEEIPAEVIVAQGNAGDIEGVEYAEPGTNGHGASRRITRRVKMVHCPYRGGVLCGAFLANIVAEVRAEKYARVRNSHTEELVRGHLVRRMREYNVRHSHIDQNLERMKIAVYYVAKEQKQTRSDEKTLDFHGFLVPKGPYTH